MQEHRLCQHRSCDKKLVDLAYPGRRRFPRENVIEAQSDAETRRTLPHAGRAVTRGLRKGVLPLRHGGVVDCIRSDQMAHRPQRFHFPPQTGVSAVGECTQIAPSASRTRVMRLVNGSRSPR